MADPVNILCISRVTEDERARMEAVDPRVRVIDAGGWFDGEMRETWPRETAERFIPAGSTGQGTRAERDALLADAEVALVNFPFPRDLRARSPRLRWVHQRPAGASNMRVGDLWGSGVIVTTSRGHAGNLAMAEYTVGAFLHFARGFHHAQADRAAGTFDGDAYGPLLLEGKTAAVVGAGGIGREVGRLAAALGMRVIGTRRRADGPPPPGFNEIRPADTLHDVLAEADFVAICCQWTPETEKLFNAAAFAAMKPGAVLVNVARGEIVDEAALLDALAADRLRGVALDVYRGEFEGPPDPRLWQDPRVLITPHVSSYSDERRHRAMEVFCRNLAAYLTGAGMENVIDWDRGY
jgi:phosphoglycerate dehydrogenase-like enzyme